MLKMIVASSNNFVIGKDGKIPWYLPSDLALFKAKTMGKIVVMGRKTWESLPKHKLPGRYKIVLTNNKDYKIDHKDTNVHHHYMNLVHISTERDVYIIGGAEIYKIFLPYADYIYYTKVNIECEGDTFIPNLPELDDLAIVERSSLIQEEGDQYSYRLYELSKVTRG